MLNKTCSCGGVLRIKDHGSWVGYCCPKCGNGGSYSKKASRSMFRTSKWTQRPRANSYPHRAATLLNPPAANNEIDYRWVDARKLDEKARALAYETGMVQYCE